jgi:hypothetical protein
MSQLRSDFELLQVHQDGEQTQYRSMKLLSEDPANYEDAPTEGIRRILETELGLSMPRNQRVDTSHIISIRMGTTVCACSTFALNRSCRQGCSVACRHRSASASC